MVVSLSLKRTDVAHLQVPVYMVCLYCDMFTLFNVQKGVYSILLLYSLLFFRPLLTLCLKPEPICSDWLAGRNLL